MAQGEGFEFSVFNDGEQPKSIPYGIIQRLKRHDMGMKVRIVTKTVGVYRGRFTERHRFGASPIQRLTFMMVEL